MNEEITLRDFLAASCRTDPDVKLASLFSSRWAAEICYHRADDMLDKRTKPTGDGQ